MDKNTVKKLMSMPLANPPYAIKPPFYPDREFVSFSFETEQSALTALVPEPLVVEQAHASFSFIKQDAYGLGHYNACGLLIPVKYEGVSGLYMVEMYLNASAPILEGREVWGFPKAEGDSSIEIHQNSVVCQFHLGQILCARGTMDYKVQPEELSVIESRLKSPNFTVKIFPDVTGKKPRICELVKFNYGRVKVKEAWTGKGTLEFFPHVKIAFPRLPIIKVLAARHFIAEHSIEFGEVVYDYLSDTD